MTKKDFELIAAAFAIEEINRWPDNVPSDIYYMVKRLGHTLKEENPRFDTRKFEDACLPRAAERIQERIMRGPQREGELAA